MSLVLVTGASTGLGLAATTALLDAGHQVVMHARRADRVEDQSVLDRVHAVVTGDLADPGVTVGLAEQVNAFGALDAVIHNAGTMRGPVIETNLVAPYLLTARLRTPGRAVFLSSSLHRGGRTDLEAMAVLGGPDGRQSYEDSKLLVTALAMALARSSPATPSHAVDPGWVPTRMGGRGASDDLALGHETQVWLATAPVGTVQPATGGYWYHRRAQQPDPRAEDERFQQELLDRLHAATGVALS
ncbi:hypothetical protein ASG49_00175 [Marmoricola sp. Leaf446]|uniref:SDR family NAD(P)-dependent oxidoreductase n=1 Tax=Marmoricola sp. Leaf446 TaxID=1736379 RepID=UPI0006F258E9|nr:SDR family NAD(P)-dependent oxidoreductase [Marmoricola sp. Leaf446]KQT93481.1 hypothetical protein ASG49_00175 [Marmoricola sp. Leaf446]